MPLILDLQDGRPFKKGPHSQCGLSRFTHLPAGEGMKLVEYGGRLLEGRKVKGAEYLRKNVRYNLRNVPSWPCAVN